MANYSQVTEVAGDDVSKEQVLRLLSRYSWAGNYCQDKDVVEVACGSGQGVEYLSNAAKTFIAGDIDPELVGIAKNINSQCTVEKFSADSIPVADESLDVVICFEAIYYLDFDSFIIECKRALRPEGKLLLATANPDLYDFNPSPYSKKYYGALDLHKKLSEAGFNVKLFGDSPLQKASLLQKILRPIKKAAVKFNLIPNTMAGKKLLKRLVFGKLVPMPKRLTSEMMKEVVSPNTLSHSRPDMEHKVIFCEATLA